MYLSARLRWDKEIYAVLDFISFFHFTFEYFAYETHYDDDAVDG